MQIPKKNPAMKQGQFLWMDEPAKSNYLATLKKRIDEGFYFSEQVVMHIIDEIAPVIDDTLPNES